ncbi:MAG: beta-phosphoglucomutase, partial [Bacillota bacterium]|nr:beta-phosphoglucomutase [Bacillota bacterium]
MTASAPKSPPAIEAAIFDLDGVIVDTAKYHYMAWKRLA